MTEDTEKLKIAKCKGKLYSYFKQKDYIPKYILASDIDSVKNAAYKLGYPTVPVCIKPVQGEGGKGFRIITDEKIDIFSEPFNSPKLSLEAYMELARIRIESLNYWLPNTFRERISVDCVCKNGTTYICIPRQRIETSMGVSSVSLIEKMKS